METLLDYIAPSTNALNGGLLAQRPDHYKKNYWTVIGIMVLAMFGGIGGGITRDVLLGQWPDALIDPVYLVLVAIFGFVSLFLAYGRGQRVRFHLPHDRHLVGLGRADASCARPPAQGPAGSAHAQGEDGTRLGAGGLGLRATLPRSADEVAR